MGLPEIRPYPMPTEAELPPSVARWRPDPDRALLLIHDMQHYFVDAFPAERSPVVELLANIGALRRIAADRAIPVVYSAQPGGVDRARRGLLFDLWGPGMGADEATRGFVAGVRPGPGDVVLAKWRYSAFHDSELADVIAAAGRDQLIVCGVYAHLGCLMTACDAFSRDLETFLVADAVADFGSREHRFALEYAARACAVTLSTRAVVSALRTPPAGRAGRPGPGDRAAALGVPGRSGRAVRASAGRAF